MIIRKHVFLYSKRLRYFINHMILLLIELLVNNQNACNKSILFNNSKTKELKALKQHSYQINYFTLYFFACVRDCLQISVEIGKWVDKNFIILNMIGCFEIDIICSFYEKEFFMKVPIEPIVLMIFTVICRQLLSLI